MESKLRKLFDFQKFDGNAELQSIINSTHSRYATRELSMEDMEMVNAAGVPNSSMRKKKQETPET